MSVTGTGREGSAVVAVDALDGLVRALRDRGYTVVGPTVRDKAIVLAELESADALPWGWGVTLEAGSYRLRRRGDDAVFSHAAGPQSWKSFLHPARARVWSADRSTSWSVEEERAPESRYAFLGVRPCDLRAIAILDRVLAGGKDVDPVYAGRRDDVFIVAVECVEPGATCFCTSMGTGPAAGPGYDLALTELIERDGGHRFLIRSATEAGAQVLAQLDAELDIRPVDEATVRQADAAVDAAARQMGRSMPPAREVRELLGASRTSPHWEDVASRCLTCGNCTMVCPTCFCTNFEDTTDLTGDHAERWRHWESCFDLDYGYVHGGSVRVSGASRYRQWLTHKLGTWHDQFGSSGCVGCGRCIVWCPVGIDITAEVDALAQARMLSAVSPEEEA